MMFIPLALIALLHIAVILAQIELGDIALGCPAASYRFGNYCYSLSVVVSTNFYDAQIACSTFGGTLAIVQDEETHKFLQKLNVRKYVMNYWIGLTDHENEGLWVFSDGSVLQKFDHWYFGEPNNHAKTEHCAFLWMLRGLNWNDVSCDTKHFYVCQFDEVHCPTSGNVYRRGQFCFFLSTEQETFGEARDSCLEMGGMLVMDKDEATHEALTAAIYQDRSWLDLNDQNLSSLLQVSDKEVWTRSWIGLTRSSIGRWQYMDGNLLQPGTGFWAPGEPGNLQCVSSARYWYTHNCKGERGFICQYAVDPSADKLQSSFTNNPVGKSKYGYISNRVLKVINNRIIQEKDKLFPTAASVTMKESRSGVSLGQAVFVILLLLCFILGAGCTALVFKRQVIKRQIQVLGQKRGKDDDTSVSFTTLENSDVE